VRLSIGQLCGLLFLFILVTSAISRFLAAHRLTREMFMARCRLLQAVRRDSG